MKLKVNNWLQLTSRFLKWWAAELHACANDLIGALNPSRRRVLNIYWDAARLLVVDEKLSEMTIVVEIPGGHWPEAIPLELKVAREQGNRARLFVCSEKAFVRQIQVPLAVLPHLGSAIALQLPKLLPLDAEELFTDFEVTARDSTNKVADIDLVALKKADVNPVLEHLRVWGLQVVSTHLGDASSSTHRFRFLRDGTFRHGLKLQKSDRILIGVAATLGLACASVAATEAYRGHVSLEHAKSATHEPAAAALAHRQELLARLEPLHALAQLEAAPSATALLADVTMLVPQNTWLTTLEFKDQNLRIVGVSPTSSNVVKLMSSSQLLNEVELRSSMSLGIGTGLDRFEITAQLKARTL
jgi:general secretion pathway protein L